jgi:hypothetical protein
MEATKLYPSLKTRHESLARERKKKKSLEKIVG